MHRMMAKGAALAAALLALAACNTAQGFGKDVQSGGQAIEDTAVKAQDEME